MKHENFERLVRYYRIIRENPTGAQLAYKYTVDDDELGGEEKQSKRKQERKRAKDRHRGSGSDNEKEQEEVTGRIHCRRR
jgi:hypothetical protein